MWEVLTDFTAYDERISYMKIGETAQVGTRLSVHMGASGGRGMAFKPTVLAATPDDELRWLGKLGLGGIVDGEHFFILDSNADGTTHLSNGERYSGALALLIHRAVHSATCRLTPWQACLSHDAVGQPARSAR